MLPNGMARRRSRLSPPLPVPPREAGVRAHTGAMISVPTARRQAAEHGHPPELEIRTLLLHGLLHCLGYDHEADQGEMERLERRLRRTWIGASAEQP